MDQSETRRILTEEARDWRREIPKVTKERTTETETHKKTEREREREREREIIEDAERETGRLKESRVKTDLSRPR